MIQITKTKQPDILKVNAQFWTIELLNKIKEIQREKNVEKRIKLEKEKETIIANYRHPEIKEALENSSSKTKCVYCESQIKPIDFGDIEHFHAKSLYPRYTFHWNNFLLSCQFCNRFNGKGTHDTIKQPIVNLERENPEDYFTYEDIRISAIPNSALTVIAKRTIEVCDLRRVDLIRPMAIILEAFAKNEDDLKFKLEAYNKLTQSAAKVRHLAKIHSDLRYLKSLTADDQSYAGFLRYLLRKSPIVQTVIHVLNKDKEILGLVNDFVLL